MKLSLASRSGEINSASASSANTARRSVGHSSRLVELIVNARRPIRSAAEIWFRINASKGDTINVGPKPRSRSIRVAMK